MPAGEVKRAFEVARAYRRWLGLRGACHQGWWLVTSLYLVVVAELSAAELVLIGGAQALVELVAEVPTGVVADTVSRRLSLVISHLLIAAAMAATALVESFWALAATQMLWGLGWTFASGADVAWVTDELPASEPVDRVLAGGARFAQIGAAAGLLGFGGLAWVVGLRTSMGTAAAGMLAIGVLVVARFPERGFARGHASRVGPLEIFQRGLAIALRDRQISSVVVATFLLNGAAVAFDRLYPKHLLALGLGGGIDPIVWLTSLGLVALLLGAGALRWLESRIEGPNAPARLYRLACGIGVFGLLALAAAPTVEIAMAGVLLVAGIAWALTRSVSQIWVNRQTTSGVRATVQSFLSQAEVSGELAFGVVLGALAAWSSVADTLLVGAFLVLLARVAAGRGSSSGSRA